MQSALIDLFDLDADLAQLGDEDRRMFRDTALDLKLAPGNGGRDEECARLYAVGDDRVLCAAESLYAFDTNGRRARAAHTRSHAVEKLCEVCDLRLARSVVNR